MNIQFFFRLIFFLILASGAPAMSQSHDIQRIAPTHSAIARIRDSITSVRLPLLPFPEQYRHRSLPPVVDNTLNEYWHGIRDQFMFYSCQQHAGVGYVFSYEINRARNKPGSSWENCYPPHYTWNFMNEGDRYTGANFLQSFEIIKQQGHLTSDDYGNDSSQSYLGWISGYDKYYRGMTNRIKQVYAIQVNNYSGINQLRNYLYDHLDGSATGGIVCFTTSSGTLYNMMPLPAGTTEEGKNVILSWSPDPDHGLTIVGYNDSIRFDVNQDGQFTNNLDINGDGVVDVRDWEIGGFKIANSYGGWWSDEGYVYALYASFSMDYPYGGVWNNRVYAVEPDYNYKPLLTVKVSLSHNARNKIKLLAGVSGDTTLEMPEHVIDFPIFNFQGGNHFMQGNDTIPDNSSIELGLDVTSLVNYIPSGEAARYFLMVEEQDPEHLGEGTINEVSFINYENEIHEFPARETDLAIADNGLTLVSAVATIIKPVVQITTDALPPFNNTQPYQAQLTAIGGAQPYAWSLVENYTRQPSATPLPPIGGSSIVVHQEFKSFVAVPLPFSFPFYGKNRDTIYVNNYGFIAFEPYFLPEPYVTDEMNMLESFPVIAPSFSQNYAYLTSDNDGIWFNADANQATIKWRASVAPYYTTSSNDFALVLYPDGKFAFIYGTMDNRNFIQKTFCGVSKGDNKNFNLDTQWNANELSDKSWMYYPSKVPQGILLNESGLLTVAGIDPSSIYNLNIRVADAAKIEDSQVFNLSDGLIIEHQLVSDGGEFLKPGKPASITLRLTNQGNASMTNLQLSLRTADSLVQITDSLQTVALLEPGQTLSIPAAFSLTVSGLLPNDYPVMMNINARLTEKSWNNDICLRVAAPVIIIESPQISDGANNLLDPGEVADLVVHIRNSGLLGADNLELNLFSRDSLVIILSSDVIPIDQLSPFSLNEYRFQLLASRATHPGTSDTLYLILNDSSGILQSREIILSLGKKPVAVVNLSVSKGSMLAMVNALDSLHVDYDTINSLLFDYNLYSSIFLILGTNVQESHTITVEEGASLSGYLLRNGNLYMEGYSTWYYLNKTPLHPYFKYTSEKIPVYFYPEVAGVAQTFADSMTYNYSSPVNYAVFSFQPKTPAYSTLTNQDSLARNLEIVYDGADYKTIGAIPEFGSMTGNGEPSSQKTLMQRYLDFFKLNTTGPYPYFHASQTIVNSYKTLNFTDDSFDNIVSRIWEFEGGEPSTSSETNPTILYSQPGKFDVKLTVSDGIHTKAILKKDYILVEQSTGITSRMADSLFRIYPNPTTGAISISVNPQISGTGTIAIFDLTGRKMNEFRCELGKNNLPVALQLPGYRKGMYLVLLKCGDIGSTQKLVVE
ncbi:MAG: T9SS type A sorting domain-containing protein [Bacteroidota bacterium]